MPGKNFQDDYVRVIAPGIDDEQKAEYLILGLVELYPWHWGDGYGGALFQKIRNVAIKRGWQTEPEQKPLTEIEQLRRTFNKGMRNKAITIISVRDGWFCKYCAKALDLGSVQIDHVIPLAKGGSNDLDNLVFACKSCNSSKYTRDLEEWKP